MAVAGDGAINFIGITYSIFKGDEQGTPARFLAHHSNFKSRFHYFQRFYYVSDMSDRDNYF